MIKELLFYMKYCPNCGKEMSGEFCSNCGYPKSNNTTINRDELLNAYASKNANKVYNRSWNWSAFFFGPVYYLYRKMWVEGIVLWGITIILIVIFNLIDINFLTLGFNIGFLIAQSMLFSKLYINHANKQIDMILFTNPSRDQALLECQRRGGVATWVAAVLGVMYGIVIVVFLIAVIFYGLLWPNVKEKLCEEAICNADRSECYTLDENGSIDWEGSCN